MFLKRLFNKKSKTDNEIDMLLAAFSESHSIANTASCYEVVVYFDMPDGTSKERRTTHKTLEEAQATAKCFKIGEDIDLFGNGILGKVFDVVLLYPTYRF